MIRVTSKQEGFRRCGLAHPGQATDHADDRFTPEELAALEAEPMLVVEHLATPPASSDQGEGYLLDHEEGTTDESTSPEGGPQDALTKSGKAKGKE